MIYLSVFKNERSGPSHLTSDSRIAAGLRVRGNSCSPLMGSPSSPDTKESACNAGDPGLIPGSGRSPGKGSGNPFQYSCLENFMDRGAWWVTVHGVTRSWTQLSDQHFPFTMGILNYFTVKTVLSSWAVHIQATQGSSSCHRSIVRHLSF